jgi:hypothetical protein
VLPSSPLQVCSSTCWTKNKKPRKKYIPKPSYLFSRSHESGSQRRIFFRTRPQRPSSSLINPLAVPNILRRSLSQTSSHPSTLQSPTRPNRAHRQTPISWTKKALQPSTRTHDKRQGPAPIALELAMSLLGITTKNPAFLNRCVLVVTRLITATDPPHPHP